MAIRSSRTVLVLCIGLIVALCLYITFHHSLFGRKKLPELSGQTTLEPVNTVWVPNHAPTSILRTPFEKQNDTFFHSVYGSGTQSSRVGDESEIYLHLLSPDPTGWRFYVRLSGPSCVMATVREQHQQFGIPDNTGNLGNVPLRSSIYRAAFTVVDPGFYLLEIMLEHRHNRDLNDICTEAAPPCDTKNEQAALTKCFQSFSRECLARWPFASKVDERVHVSEIEILPAANALTTAKKPLTVCSVGPSTGPNSLFNGRWLAPPHLVVPHQHRYSEYQWTPRTCSWPLPHESDILSLVERLAPPPRAGGNSIHSAASSCLWIHFTGDSTTREVFNHVRWSLTDHFKLSTQTFGSSDPCQEVRKGDYPLLICEMFKGNHHALRISYARSSQTLLDTVAILRVSNETELSRCGFSPLVVVASPHLGFYSSGGYSFEKVEKDMRTLCAEEVFDAFPGARVILKGYGHMFPAADLDKREIIGRGYATNRRIERMNQLFRQACMDEFKDRQTKQQQQHLVEPNYFDMMALTSPFRGLVSDGLHYSSGGVPWVCPTAARIVLYILQLMANEK